MTIDTSTAAMGSNSNPMEDTMANPALIETKVQTAAYLVGLLDRLKDGGFDLNRIVLTNGDGDPVGLMSLYAADDHERKIKPDAQQALCFWLGDLEG